MSFARIAVAVAILTVSFSAMSVDDKAAMKLARKSGCLKCHAIDKKKDAPSLQDIAAKHKGKADAKDELFTHLTTHPMVEVDGKKEKHDSLKTDDEAEIRNVIDWILAM